LIYFKASVLIKAKGFFCYLLCIQAPQYFLSVNLEKER